MLEDAVRCVSGLDPGIDRKMPVCQGAKPDFVIALPRTDEGATVLPKKTFDVRGIIGHQTWTRMVRSERRWMFAVFSADPESSINSGTRTRNFSIRASIVSASVTRPGTSSLSATQTPASSSQIALTSTFLLSGTFSPFESRLRGVKSTMENSITERILVDTALLHENRHCRFYGRVCVQTLWTLNGGIP